ncbi:hypothetical protein JCM4814A_02900 [Streptomyces phaeofaciens JCM 4814]|uniref:Uncharacterized protein n=1 Tax=Streptomyces phaeofaciens TaxID=68254 RepID=A0A918M110_9ACTN|nr:hypothetical protein GCM10010226_91290 [Streptomyces phaeofaciens]
MELPPPLGIVVRVVAVGVPDLPGVLVRRHLPLGVSLDTRDVLGPQRFAQMLDHWPRDRKRVLQKEPNIPHRAHLQGETETVVVTAALHDQLTVLVIEEEEAFQLGSCRLLSELPIRLSLLVS